MMAAAVWADGGAVSGPMAEAAFLLKTGWTPEQYDAAPDELVTMMYMLMNAEAERSKADA